MLEEVGLADRAGDKFRTYSLGMKQRLAIAATLLKDPDLLIFDEPTNGLDPAGIHEIRADHARPGRPGKTVLVSSHILAEVQQVADTVSIIGRGRLLAEGRVDDILDAAGGQRRPGRVADPAAAAGCSTERGFGYDRPADGALSVDDRAGRDPLDAGPDHPLPGRAGLYATELVREPADLERCSWSSPPARPSGPARRAAPAARVGPGRRRSPDDPTLLRAETRRLLSRRVHPDRAARSCWRLIALFQLQVNDAGHAAVGDGVSAVAAGVRGGPPGLGGQPRGVGSRVQ